MKIKRKQTGLALVLAVLAAVILMITGGALLAVGYQSRAYQIHTAQEISARSAADAGMSKAVDEINQLFEADLLDGSFPTETNVSLAGADSDYSYKVIKNGIAYTISSTGHCETATRTVYANLTASGPLYAVLVGDTFYMKNNGVVTGSCGTLSTAPDAFDVKKGTVTGDAFVGVGGDPANINCTVEGRKYALESPITLSDVSVPTAAETAGPKTDWNTPADYTLGSTGTTTYVHYTEVTINGTLNISGHVVMYVDGDLSDVGSGINVNEDSTLELFISGDLGSDENGVDLSSNSDDPSALRIYGVSTSTQEFTLGKNKTKAIGSIYAPKANVTIGKNTSLLIGQIIANSFWTKNIADVQFDPRAADGNNNPLARIVVQKWRE